MCVPFLKEFTEKMFEISLKRSNASEEEPQAVMLGEVPATAQ